ncbi:PfkB family carbohydrate kinase [Brachybacterium huguangmaarense]|uniref:PfkB family carbohydrate kinase n=1 Tax=Brachybacterium huguangmaarense TaxID=1652028 RepID=A0ABY6G051_9MICO|nr:PfkB family carbohydrate kinase [Brachybacterium huguangmaarense]UYG16054.1 PfkB family carbohydrate kinase [Brachybacterium huguangmaarense]
MTEPTSSGGRASAPRTGPRGLFFGLATLDVTHTVASRPAPDSKVTATSQHVIPGGPALNAAVAFAGLGGRATLAAPVGGTAVSGILRADLDRWGVRLLDLAAEDFEPPISSVTVVADGGRDVVSIDARGFPADLDPSAMAEALSEADIALFDGHGAGAAVAAARLAGEAGVPLVLDAGRWRPVYADLFPLAREVVCSDDFAVPGRRDVLRAVREAGPEVVVRTGGAGPIGYLAAGLGDAGDAEGRVAPPTGVAVRDTNGAGDIFHGAYCWARAGGAGVRDAVVHAAEVASFSCGVDGTRAWIEPWRRRR